MLVGLLCAAGCSSLPTIVPDLARRPGPAVQLAGALGPLSAAQSKAVLGELRSRGQELNAVVLGADFGRQVQAMFDKDLAASDAVTLEQWQRRALDLRMKEWLGRVWEYWL